MGDFGQYIAIFGYSRRFRIQTHRNRPNFNPIHRMGFRAAGVIIVELRAFPFDFLTIPDAIFELSTLNLLTAFVGGIKIFCEIRKFFVLLIIKGIRGENMDISWKEYGHFETLKVEGMWTLNFELWKENVRNVEGGG